MLNQRSITIIYCLLFKEWVRVPPISVCPSLQSVSLFVTKLKYPTSSCFPILTRIVRSGPPTA